jgi:ribonuclease Y
MEVYKKMLEFGVGLVTGIIGTGAFYIYKARYKEDQLEKEIQKKRTDLEEELKRKREAFELELKDLKFNLRKELERNFRKETRIKWVEIRKNEKLLEQREQTLNRLASQIENKETLLEKLKKEAEELKIKYEQIYTEAKKELEKIAQMSTDEAKREILERAEKELEYELAVKIKQMEEKLQEESEQKALDIITTAMERCSMDQIVDSTVSTVSLPDDEMKGRIIGREGRNIRAFESLTGVSLIVDDTPEAVVLSCFDPIRREVARMTLEKLVKDGRIHPTRIENVYQKSKAEFEKRTEEIGQRVVLDMGIRSINKEIVKTLGKLEYRTSYGQNVLKHSIEVAHLAGMMASELGINPETAKRAALLHDIGKVFSYDLEGSHAQIGADFLRKHGESEEVIHAVLAHHEEVKPESVEDILVKLADAISASRVGARRETLEIYVKRLQELENLATQFEGVEKAYAIQAGREVRVMVNPQEIDDVRAQKIAQDIAKKIEKELEYPGQVKVVVVREIRQIEYAK